MRQPFLAEKRQNDYDEKGKSNEYKETICLPIKSFKTASKN